MSRRKSNPDRTDDYLGRTAADYGGGYGTCPTGKRGYASKRLAKNNDKRRQRLGRRYYRCAECDAIHSTTMSYMEQVARGYVEADQ